MSHYTVTTSGKNRTERDCKKEKNSTWNPTDKSCAVTEYSKGKCAELDLILKKEFSTLCASMKGGVYEDQKCIGPITTGNLTITWSCVDVDQK